MKISLSAMANEIENNFPVYAAPEDMFGGSHNGFRIQFIGKVGQSKQESLSRAIIKLLAKNYVYVYSHYFQAMGLGDLFEGVNTFAELRLMLVEYVE